MVRSRIVANAAGQETKTRPERGARGKTTGLGTEDSWKWDGSRWEPLGGKNRGGGDIAGVGIVDHPNRLICIYLLAVGGVGVII